MKKFILFLASAAIIVTTIILIYNPTNKESKGIHYKLVDNEWVIDTLNTDVMYLDSTKVELDSFNIINNAEKSRLITYIQFIKMKDDSIYIERDSIKSMLGNWYYSTVCTNDTISLNTLKDTKNRLMMERVGSTNFTDYITQNLVEQKELITETFRLFNEIHRNEIMSQ